MIENVVAAYNLAGDVVIDYDTTTQRDQIDSVEVKYGLTTAYGSQAFGAVSGEGASVGSSHCQVTIPANELPGSVFQYSAGVNPFTGNGDFSGNKEFNVAPTSAVVKLLADPQNYVKGTMCRLSATVTRNNAPVANAKVQFRLDMGESSGHGTFSPVEAQADANGLAVSQFNANRPGTIHLVAACGDAEGKIDVQVSPK